MASLPSIAVLQSCLNNNYVGYIQDESPLNGYIHFRNSLYNPVHEQLAFEPSEIVPGCYHIRCIYTNKYWTRKSSAVESPIVAIAKEQKPKEPTKAEDEAKTEIKTGTEKEPKENVLDWDSTLFKVDLHPNGVISIKHISTGDLLSIKGGNKDGAEAKSDDNAPNEEAGCLICVKGNTIDTKTRDKQDPISFATTMLSYVFRVIDLDNFVLLPKNVVFKADNGRYYQTHAIQGDSLGPYLQASAADTTVAACLHEVSHDSNGFILIKARSNNRYWRIASSSTFWIAANTPNPNNGNWMNMYNRYQAFRVGSNNVVLRTQGLNGFIRRETGQGRVDCLFLGNAPTPIREAHLGVEEPVRQRLIDNVAFQIENARIFDEQLIHVTHSEYYNHDPNGAPTYHNYHFEDTERTFSTWQARLGLNLNYNVRIRAGIPFVKSARIEVGAEIEAEYTWGREKEHTRTIIESGTTDAAPGQMTRVVLVATRARFEVPFSYTQRDVTTDWRNEVQNLDDGNYIGGSISNFRVDTYRFDLPLKD